MTDRAAASTTRRIHHRAICDDHLVLAEGLAAVLAAEADITVAAIAGTVAEVIAMADRHHPDVVLIDYELPDGDGVTAIRALKQAHPERDGPL